MTPRFVECASTVPPRPSEIAMWPKAPGWGRLKIAAPGVRAACSIEIAVPKGLGLVSRSAVGHAPGPGRLRALSLALQIQRTRKGPVPGALAHCRNAWRP